MQIVKRRFDCEKKISIIIILFILLGIITENTHAVELDYKWGKLDVHGFISQGFIKSS